LWHFLHGDETTPPIIAVASVTFCFSTNTVAPQCLQAAVVLIVFAMLRWFTVDRTNARKVTTVSPLNCNQSMSNSCWSDDHVEMVALRTKKTKPKPKPTAETRQDRRASHLQEPLGPIESHSATVLFDQVSGNLFWGGAIDYLKGGIRKAQIE